MGYGISDSLTFVKVSDAENVWYDLVEKYNLQVHLNTLQGLGYEAVEIDGRLLPPCKFRDFVTTNNPGQYQYGFWHEGKQLEFKK